MAFPTGFNDHWSLAGGDRIASVRHGQFMAWDANEVAKRWAAGGSSFQLS